MKLRSLMMSAVAALPTVMAASAEDTEALTKALLSFPKCASECFGQGLTKTSCDLTDVNCICTDQTLMDTVTACVTIGCTTQEALVTRNITATTCKEPVRDKSQGYVVVADVLGIITGIFVIQRFAYKWWAKLDFGLDDWFCLLTTICGAPSTAMASAALQPNGIGRDVWTLTADQITRFGKYFYVIEVLYFFEVSTIKMSLLFFYIRIFPTKLARQLLWGTVAFNTAFATAYVISAIFQCTPVDYFWLKWDGKHEGHCVDVNALAWSNSAIGIALDLWMLAIPLWQLHSLQLNWKRKIGVAMMFFVGTFVTVVSILRLRSLVRFRADSMNPTWDFLDVTVWSVIEINVAIICACMPSLRLLLVRIFPKLWGSTQRYYGNQSSSHARGGGTGDRVSRRFGTTSVSRADQDDFPGVLKSNQIGYSKTYAVEYGDTDELQLVHMKDTDHKSARSDGSISNRDFV